MVVWLIVLLTGIIVAAWWFNTRRLDWQFARITSQLGGITNQRQVNAATGKRIMQQIYKILKASLTTGKADDAYRAFDLLKLALGHGLGRPGEPAQLTGAVYLALRLNQPDAAGHGIDAFRPMIRNMTAIEIAAAVEQLALIAVICLKQRQNFLAARAVEIISSAMGMAQDDAVRMAVMSAVRLTGLTALRRKDIGLIRELQSKMAAWLAAEPLSSSMHEQAAWVLTAWLHRVVKAGEVNMYEIVTQHIRQLSENKGLLEHAVTNIIIECSHLAGMDSLNPYSKMSGAVSMLSLELAVQVRTPNAWRLAVDGSVQAARLAVEQRTLAESFDILYPLFENGRRLLTAELNASPANDLFRQQALYILMRECLHLVEFVTRQNFTTTAVDIIDQTYQDWIKRQANDGQHKSIKRFCQLLFLYYTRIKRRQKRLTAVGSAFNSESVITFANQERLKKLGYLS